MRKILKIRKRIYFCELRENIINFFEPKIHKNRKYNKLVQKNYLKNLGNNIDLNEIMTQKNYLGTLHNNSNRLSNYSHLNLVSLPNDLMKNEKSFVNLNYIFFSNDNFEPEQMTQAATYKNPVSIYFLNKKKEVVGDKPKETYHEKKAYAEILYRDSCLNLLIRLS